VCPYLIDLSPAELGGGPLSQFQAKQANKNQTWELILAINRALGDEASLEERLRRIFERWWPDLEQALNALPAAAPDQNTKHPLEDTFKETLEEFHVIKRDLEAGKMLEKEMFEATLEEVRGIRRDIEARWQEEKSIPIVLDHELEAALQRSEAQVKKLQAELETAYQQIRDMDIANKRSEEQIKALQHELEAALQRSEAQVKKLQAELETAQKSMGFDWLARYGHKAPSQ
jgi:DNA repair exonuclease SbcCD ATPase subunit